MGFILNSIVNNMRRKCQYCGMEYNIPFLQLRLLIHDRIRSRCGYCGYVSTYRMIAHYPHDTTDNVEKEVNKRFEENKRRLWSL